MLVVVWLRQAQFNLDRQIRYIAGRNIVVAMEQDAMVADAVARLAEFPESGRQAANRARGNLSSLVPLLSRSIASFRPAGKYISSDSFTPNKNTLPNNLCVLRR
jgi:plasmid stabilization system protein ParE